MSSARVPELHPTLCAICGTFGSATELYAERLDPGSFSPEVFSARRTPDMNHYRMARCVTCNLVRSDPIANPEVLAALYTRSTQSYDDELPNLKETYGRYIAKLEKYRVRKGTLLEIGCGSGFVLDVALSQGYAGVVGVEPSRDAIAKASPQVRPQIHCGMAEPGRFREGSIDVICLFQVLDHIADPNSLLAECFRILKPGGLILALNHNAASLSARLMGERSPIVDVEHAYLYDKKTMARIFSKHGFAVSTVASAWNTYSLSYFFRLLPLRGGLKPLVLKMLKALWLGGLRLSVPMGNLYLVARKNGAERA